jgi:hypothetical protein
MAGESLCCLNGYRLVRADMCAFYVSLIETASAKKAPRGFLRKEIRLSNLVKYCCQLIGSISKLAQSAIAAGTVLVTSFLSSHTL